MKTRQAAVSGMFYSSDKKILHDEIFVFFENSSGNPTKHLGVMLPHAGHVYSGQTTAKVLAEVIIPDTVILLCPDHYGFGQGLSVYPIGMWETPFGQIEIDDELAKEVLLLGDMFLDNPDAHRKEHSAEVIVPFFQFKKPNFKLVPIMVSERNPNVLLNAGELLGNMLKTCGKDVLLVASSDMTHFESKERAFAKDKKAIDKILDMDAEGLYAIVRDNDISMCGVLPATVWLSALKCLSPADTRLIDYTNSGEVTRDFSEVVAYAGITVK